MHSITNYDSIVSDLSTLSLCVYDILVKFALYTLKGLIFGSSMIGFK